MEVQKLYGELTIKGIQHPVDFTIIFGDNNTALANLTLIDPNIMFVSVPAPF